MYEEFNDLNMSGSSIMRSASMHDNAKHTYHSIPMEPPGAIPLTERSSACRCSKKVITLILASALLWIIILDIILVVYKSHRLSKLANEENVDVIAASHTAGFVFFGIPLSQTNKTTDRNSVPPVKDHEHTNFITDEPSTTLSSSTEGKEFAKRFDIAIIDNTDYAEVPAWLSRLHHSDSSSRNKPLVTTTSNENQPQATTPNSATRNDHIPPPPHVLIPPFEEGVPPPPPSFLPMLPRSHRFREFRPRRPWVGSGRWGSRERFGMRKADSLRKREQWRPDEEDFARKRPTEQRLTPSPTEETKHSSKRLTTGDFDQRKPTVVNVLSKPLDGDHPGDTQDRGSDPVSAFFKLISSFIDGSRNDTESDEHSSKELGFNKHNKFSMKNLDDHEDNDDDDAVIDIDILTR